MSWGQDSTPHITTTLCNHLASQTNPTPRCHTEMTADRLRGNCGTRGGKGEGFGESATPRSAEKSPVNFPRRGNVPLLPLAKKGEKKLVKVEDKAPRGSNRVVSWQVRRLVWSKVHQVQPARAGQQHIFRLYISMAHISLMGLSQRDQQLEGYPPLRMHQPTSGHTESCQQASCDDSI